MTVIEAVPLPIAVTKPSDDTVATVASLLDHAMVAPDMAEPLVSFGMAVRLSVAPMDESVVDAGLTSTLASWDSTVTDAVPDALTLSFGAVASAVIVAVPLAFAVTRPLEETVATVSSLLDHAMVAPDMALPLASFTAAERLSVSPMDESVVVDGLTSTLATRWRTVTDAVPDALTPSFDAEAVIVAVPMVFAVTRPLNDTVATVESLLDHAMVAPDTVLPLASSAVALSCFVSPIEFSVVDDGLTETRDTRWRTVTDTLADASPPFFSALTVISVSPSATAVTLPSELTVATDVFLLFQS
ncbi:MAG: hypothetical protein OXU48_01615 [candidate division Zixibacteria bacterium]|nr:hypothetical protein [candidate division Zixibacteria bacterium]